uniref:Uncharacterized protein n=1 Tax=Strongyloides venezuelensis TaxID=75913 RepID=A0A0K0FTN4_STRVS
MNPEDNVFKKIFIPMLDALTQFAVQFDITGYDNDPKKYLNKRNITVSMVANLGKYAGFVFISNYKHFLDKFDTSIGVSKNSTTPEVTTTKDISNISTTTSSGNPRLLNLPKFKLSIPSTHKTFYRSILFPFNRGFHGPSLSRGGID